MVVDGVNVRTRHTRSVPNGPSAATTTEPAPIHISNVQIVDPDSLTPTRLGVRVEVTSEDGLAKTVRTRYAKKSGKDI